MRLTQRGALLQKARAWDFAPFRFGVKFRVASLGAFSLQTQKERKKEKKKEKKRERKKRKKGKKEKKNEI